MLKQGGFMPSIVICQLINRGKRDKRRIDFPAAFVPGEAGLVLRYTGDHPSRAYGRGFMHNPKCFSVPWTKGGRCGHIEARQGGQT